MTDEQVPAGASPEDIKQATQVAGAAGAAGQHAIESGASKDETRAAIDRAVDEKVRGLQITMSDSDRDAMVDAMIERLDGMGAFSPPPAADAPAPPADAGAVTPEAAAEAASAAAESQPTPRKRTLAEKFAGI